MQVYLAQSDTTAGFLSTDPMCLNAIKGRDKMYSTLLTLNTCKKLKNLVRIPNMHKNRVRKSIKTTFIYLGKNALNTQSLAIRLVHKKYGANKIEHSDFLDFFHFMYSSSANAHKKGFDLEFALQNANSVVLDHRSLRKLEASKIFKLSNTRLKRIR